MWGRGPGASRDHLPWGWAGTGPRRGRRLWSSSRTRCRSASSSAAQRRGLVGMGQNRVRPPGSEPCPQRSPALLSSQPCSPLMRLSSLSWYLLHICRLFSSSLQEMGRQSGTECHLGDTRPCDPAQRGPCGHCPWAALAGSELIGGACPLLPPRPALTGGGPGCPCWPVAAPAHGSPRCASRRGGTEGTPGHPAGWKTWGTAGEQQQGLSSLLPPLRCHPLLVADKARGISLDLRLELRGAHAVVGR